MRSFSNYLGSFGNLPSEHLGSCLLLSLFFFLLLFLLAAHATAPIANGVGVTLSFEGRIDTFKAHFNSVGTEIRTPKTIDVLTEHSWVGEDVPAVCRIDSL